MSTTMRMVGIQWWCSKGNREILKHYKDTVLFSLKKYLEELVKVDLFEPVGLIFGDTWWIFSVLSKCYHSFKMLLNKFPKTLLHLYSPTMARSRSLEGYYNFQRCCGK